MGNIDYPFTIIAKGPEQQSKLTEYFGKMALAEKRDIRDVRVTPIQPIPVKAIVPAIGLIDTITSLYGGHIMSRVREQAAVDQNAAKASSGKFHKPPSALKKGP